MHPFPRHDRFFSSLSQVEKRLASEKEDDPTPSPFPSLCSSSPLFLSNPKPIQETAITNNDSSGPPLDFLSNSPTTSIQIQHQEEADEDPDDEMDDIDRLMSLLGLSLPNWEDSSRDYSSCDCSIGGGGFFGKVVGVKRPRCGKETERLDGWIASFYNDGKREPARLAHLLLGKAVASNDGSQFGAIGFPATVADFLDHDPPSEKANEE